MGYGQDLDGCGRFIKYSLHFINLFICIGGIIILGLGIWSLVDYSSVNELLGTNLFIGAVYVLVITGALVTVISCLGCYGSANEIRCMLLLYFLVLFLVFVAMLVGGILGFVFRETAEKTIRNQMHSTLVSYGTNKYITQAWDDTQERLQCCGITDYRDWNDKLPASCCREPVPNKKLACQTLIPSPHTMYTVGCLNATTAYVKSHAAIVSGVAIGVACLLIFGMIFSCALVRMID